MLWCSNFLSSMDLDHRTIVSFVIVSMPSFSHPPCVLILTEPLFVIYLEFRLQKYYESWIMYNLMSFKLHGFRYRKGFGIMNETKG